MRDALRARRAATFALLPLLLSAAFPLWLPSAAAANSSAVAPFLLGLDFPVAFAFSPDGRLFFTEKFGGRIRVVDVTGPTPQLLPTALDTVGNLNTTLEMGLLGLALDPDWATTPWVYVYHTFDNGTLRENQITRYWASANVSARNETILRGVPASDYHNGGILQFGPDGKLYVTTGDAQDGGRSPDITYLGGKVLRLDKNGTVPADNPFPGSFVYTTGHRNVFGLTFNPLTGGAVITENGELDDDEVNVLRPGANYGWPWDHGFANNSTNVDPLWAITPTIAPTGIVADISRHAGDGRCDLIFGDWTTASLRRLVVGPPGYDTLLEEELVFTRAVSHILDLDFGPGGLLYLSTPEGIFTSNLQVVGNQLPVPILKANRTAQFEGRPLSFDGTQSFDPEASGIYSHSWDFGDGTNATGQFVVHAYPNAGNFTVRLTVTDEQNAANSTSVVIRVVPLSANEPPVPVLFANRFLQFEGRPIGFGGGDSYDPEDGGIYSFDWSFGDGTSATGSWAWHNFTLRGNYSVRLTVTDELGVPNSTTVSVRILALSENTPPTAVASASSLRGWAGRRVNFSATASFDAEGGVTAYLWEFGDGGTSTLGYVGHVYTFPGDYSVRVTVWDEVGAQASASFAFAVLDPATNAPPVAVLQPPTGLPKVGVSLTFDGSPSSDAEGGIFLHEWSFGDGAAATGAVVSHTFDAEGSFLVRLTVTDELGATNFTLLTLVVYETSIPPTAAFVSNSWTAPLGSPLFFDASPSTDPDGWIAQAHWDFGDGTTAEGLQRWHYFRAPGEYNVTLTITDASGLVRSTSSTFHITPPERAAPSPYGALLALLAAAVIVAAAVSRRS